MNPNKLFMKTYILFSILEIDIIKIFNAGKIPKQIVLIINLI